MTSYKQIEANRRNAFKSTGPKTETAKQASRCNAVRHGLTAETVITALEDADDYQAFEAAIVADYDAQSAVERELVLRLASLLWRLRRASTMEAGLFEIQANHLKEFRQTRRAFLISHEVYALSVNSEMASRCVRWLRWSNACLASTLKSRSHGAAQASGQGRRSFRSRPHKAWVEPTVR